MENIIEELIDEKLKRDSVKDLELEAVGKIQNHSIKLYLEKFDDDWKVYTTDIGFDIHSRIFGDNYHGAKECFNEYVKQYNLKDSKIVERNKSIRDHLLVVVIFIIITIELIIIL